MFLWDWRRFALSRVDRYQAAYGELEEQALRGFEPKLQALNLGLDQIEQQSLAELEDSLERIADAIRHADQFGTIRLKVSADAGVVLVRTAAETHFEVGILPVLLQRKTLVLERIRSLRPEGSTGDLRQLINQRVEDVSLRDELLALVEKQREQHEEAAQRDAVSRLATEALAAENQSIFLAMTAGAIRTRPPGSPVRPSD